MIRVGVIDSSGTVIPIARSVVKGLGTDGKVIDFGDAENLVDGEWPQADVLLLGPEELDSDLVERVKDWRLANPTRTTVAVAPKGVPSASELRAMGFDRIARGELTVSKAIQLAAEKASSTEMKRGLVITIASATGGCGKTFFATNMAASIGAGGSRVLLVDLDLQFGEVAIALRVRHGYSIYDGLYDSKGRPLPEEALEEQLDDLIYHHRLGFDVLQAPKDPVFADYVGARDASRVLEAVVSRYDVIVVDTPPSLNEVVLTTLDASDIVAVLATPDVPSLKNLGVFLDTLKRLKIPDEHLRLVLNKTDSDIGLDVPDIQRAFNDRFIGTIPQSRLASRALNLGTVAIEINPRAPVSKRIVEALKHVLPDHLATAATLPEGRGRLSSLLRRLFKKEGPRAEDVADIAGGSP